MSADDGGATIEVARPSDAHQAAELAAVKRAEYEQYSPVFWRVADHAAEIHEPFLAKCIADPGFSSFAARSHEQLVGIAIASHRVFPPPFRSDPQPSWLVDDFFVSSAEAWSTVGIALLDAVEEAACAAGASRLIVLTARLDAPKRATIEAAGYERGASWWVHPVLPREGKVPALRTTEAIVGPAPPVYDPGGQTALALEMGDPSEVDVFDEWASASNAVLAIVPARSVDRALEQALASAGYQPASDWLVKELTRN